MLRSRAAALPCLLVLTACGSTVAMSGSATTTYQDGLSAPGAAPGAASTSGGALTTGAAGTTGTTQVAGGKVGAAPAGTTQAGAFSPVAGGTSQGSYGPGVDAKTMSVGFQVTINGEQANAAAGGAGISTEDQELNYRILVDDVNAHGGIAGRKVVPVFHKTDATSTQTVDQQVSQMCADFTQDHRVFAATVGGDEGLLNCYDKAKVVTSYDNLGTLDAATFARHPYYSEISLFNLNRLATAQVAALVAQKYFTPWDATVGAPGGPGTKVGVVTYDSRTFKDAAQHDLLPALARTGYPVVPVFVHRAQSTGEISQLAGEISNAVLRFRQEGVEHVVIWDDSAMLSLLFLNNASGQHYSPRYGFNSQNAAQLLLTGGNIQKEQLIGSQGIGWFPILDLRVQDNPETGPYSNAARRSCTALYRKHGVTFKDTNAAGVALLSCNAVYYLKAAIERGLSATPGAINRDTFLAGVNSLGSSFESAMTFRTSFGPSKHDGAGALRYYAWDDGCGCMRYTSPVKAVA